MAKLQITNILKNNKGQSFVEYVLLLALISTLATTIYNNKKFKEFIGPNSSFFNGIRKGMDYSYRYGRNLDKSTSFDSAMQFDYRSREHDLYYNQSENRSRFFSGAVPYGE